MTPLISYVFVCFRKTNRLARILFYCFCYLLCRAKMPSSKFEANPMLHLQVKCSSFSVFPLVCSCSNAYFRTYAIIYFLADQLVFLNTVTFYLPFLLDLSFSYLIYFFSFDISFSSLLLFYYLYYYLIFTLSLLFLHILPLLYQHVPKRAG